MSNVQNAVDAIVRLQSTTSKNDKVWIVEQMAKSEESVFFRGLRLALDNMITFGVKALPEGKQIGNLEQPWEQFEILADKLRKRQLTGHAALNAISEFISGVPKSHWELWYKPILQKDLRCGMSKATVNKAVEKKWPKFAIPVFSCQLATDILKKPDLMSGIKHVQIKLDGVRVLTFVYPDGTVEMYSRSGKSLQNFPLIASQMSKLAHEFHVMVFDGEVVSDSFQQLMTQVNRKDNVNSKDADLYLFDVLPLSEFEQGESKLNQSKRSEQLSKIITSVEVHAIPNIKYLDYQILNLESEGGKAAFADVNKKAIANGFEGIMIKDPFAKYKCKRGTSWLKLKPFIQVTLSVVGFEEGTGKNIGKLGALQCKGHDEGVDIAVDVGGGFSDAQRESFWADSKKLLGQMVEIRADAVTQNQDGTYSLRFPRFIGFRGFKQGEKL